MSEEEGELEEWVQEMLSEGHDPDDIRDSLEDADLDPGAVGRAQQASAIEQPETENKADQDVDGSQSTDHTQVSGENPGTDNAEDDRSDEEQADAKPGEASRLGRRQVAATVTGVVLVSLLVAAAATDLYKIPLGQAGGGEEARSQAAAPEPTAPGEKTGLGGDPRGLQVNISESGVQPINPSTDMETVSFVNKLGRPVTVYISPVGTSQRISPGRHIEASTSNISYFTVANPDGSNITGSLR